MLFPGEILYGWMDVCAIDCLLLFFVFRSSCSFQVGKKKCVHVPVVCVVCGLLRGRWGVVVRVLGSLKRLGRRKVLFILNISAFSFLVLLPCFCHQEECSSSPIAAERQPQGRLGYILSDVF